MSIGNQAWAEQVLDIRDTMPKGTSYKEAEVACFKVFYDRYQDDGISQEEVRDRFLANFGIKWGSFYNRLRKMESK